MDDLKRLLEDFADRAVDGIPAADVDADVARGRRALRRIRARRRVTGVLCVAAASTAVFAIGDQAKWWGGGGTEVATGPSETAAGADGSQPLSPSPAQSDESMSLYSGSAITLVSNKQTWSTIACTLAPQGWTPATPVAADHVVLTPPSARTDTDAQMVLQAAPEARSLTSVRALQSDGKVVHVGVVAGGRAVGQVKLGERWLVVQLPVGTKEWTDDVLQRFVASCSFR